MDGCEGVSSGTAGARYPVREFLEDRSAESAERVVRELDLLEAQGSRLVQRYVKPTRGEIWERRATGRSHHRVLTAAVVGRSIVHLHAFTRQSQRTPAGEIDLAQTRLAGYLERGEA